MDQGSGILKGLDGISYKERLSTLVLSSLEKRMLRGDLSAQGGGEEDAVLFSRKSSDRNGSKLHQSFGLNNM